MSPAEERGDPKRAVTRPITVVVVGLGLLTIAFVIAQCMSAVEKVREDAERSGDFIKQVGLALHNYQSQHGRFPPAAVYDKDGRALYSWRVLVLPYIEQDDLYKQFHLDEAWDSLHNIKLLPKMPGIYRAPGTKAKMMPPDHTVCHVFVGKRAAFEGKQGLLCPNDFPDGTADTILLLDAGKPVPWTKPEDLAYDPDEPLPDLQGVFKDGFWACMADGARVWVSKKTSEATLRALITRNGRDQPGPEWRDRPPR